MTTNWEHIKKTVKSELSDAADTTKKYIKIGKNTLDKMDSTNDLNNTYRELGIEVYNHITEEIKGDIQQHPKVSSLVEKVNYLKKVIKDEEKEIAMIKKGAVPPSKENMAEEKPNKGKGK